MATSILVSLFTNGPTLSRTGLHEFSITLCATSDTDTAVSISTFGTLLHHQMDVYGYKGFTFTDIESKVQIKRPVTDICYKRSNTIQTRIPALGEQSPYSVMHKMKLWDQQAMRDIVDEIEADFDPNYEPKYPTDWMWGPTADFEVGHSYEIGLGDGFGRTAGKLPMVLKNKVVIKVVE